MTGYIYQIIAVQKADLCNYIGIFTLASTNFKVPASNHSLMAVFIPRKSFTCCCVWDDNSQLWPSEEMFPAAAWESLCTAVDVPVDNLLPIYI